MTKAMGAPEFRRTLASTHAWNPYCWLNGPLARQLGIDCGQGEISEEANMSLVRFMNLAFMNLTGSLLPWGLVETALACQNVGGQPYHVQQGMQINDNAITVGSTLMWGNNMAPSTEDPERIMQLMAWDITERCQFALGSGKQYTYRTILLTEPVAGLLSKKYPQKEVLEQDLINSARRPLYVRSFSNFYSNPVSRIEPDNFSFFRYEKRIGRTE